MASDPSVAQQNDETATAILRQKKRYVAHSIAFEVAQIDKVFIV